MNQSLAFMLLLQVLLICLNAVFACAEIAIISMNDSKLAKLAAQGDKRALRLVGLTSQPARFLATIQVAITLSGFLGSAFAAENFSDGLVQWLVSLGVTVPTATLDAIAVVVITLVLSYFTLIFGELVPKRVAMRMAEPLALGLSGPISGIAKVFSPIVWFLTASTNAVLRLLGIDPDAQDEEVGEEEIRMMVEVGGEKGAIAREEQQFIQNVFAFDDLTAVEIATHRTDLVLLRMEDDMAVWDSAIHGSRHTLYPICDGSTDNIVGILNAKDYFRLGDKSRATVLEQAVRPPYFVPESIKADVLLRNMKQSHNSLAVVLDEYGGLCGIITLSDLVAQLVGSLGDEEPEELEQTAIRLVGEQTWQIAGGAPLAEVAQTLGVALPCQDYDTFGGLLFGALGTIPQDGGDIALETAGLSICGAQIQGHQVVTARVRPAAAVQPAAL